MLLFIFSSKACMLSVNGRRKISSSSLKSSQATKKATNRMSTSFTGLKPGVKHFDRQNTAIKCVTSTLRKIVSDLMKMILLLNELLNNPILLVLE